MKVGVTGLALASMLLAALQVAAERHEVRMLNQGEDGMMAFEPGYLRAQPGDTVVFVATDPSHNSESVSVPEGAAAWMGAMDEEISITLDTEGVYLYQCAPHLPLGMVGVIQVGEPVNMDAVRARADAMKGSVAVNAERLDAYLSQVR